MRVAVSPNTTLSARRMPRSRPATPWRAGSKRAIGYQRSGAHRVPMLRVGDAVFWGEERIAEAAAAARWVADADG